MKKRILLFLTLEFILYLCFLYMDFTGTGDSRWIKYSGMLLCLLFSLSELGRRSRDSLLVSAALLFTSLADFFLLLIDRWYTAGVLFFCAVQLLYGLRLTIWRQHISHKEWILRMLLPVSAFLILASLDSLTLLTAAAAFYGFNLIINAVRSLSFFHAGLQKRLFCIGLWMFLCCDICVAIHNLNSGINALQAFANLGMWLFYLPSQVLIALSCHDYYNYIRRTL